jgi:hypothetical protein
MKLGKVLKDVKFVEFLKKHNAYEAYVKNWRNPGVNPIARTDFIVYAFHWRSSPEGAVHWNDLNKKWNYECKSKLEKYLLGVENEA